MTNNLNRMTSVNKLLLLHAAIHANLQGVHFTLRNAKSRNLFNTVFSARSCYLAIKVLISWNLVSFFHEWETLRRGSLYELAGSGNDFSVSHLLRTRPSSSKSVIVSVAVSKLDCIKLIFVEPGAKINGQYWRHTLLMQQLLPAMRSIAEYVFFHQYNATAHHAREVVELLRCETHQFINPDMRPCRQQSWPKSGRLPHLWHDAGACISSARTNPGRGRVAAVAGSDSQDSVVDAHWSVAKRTETVCQHKRQTLLTVRVMILAWNSSSHTTK